MTIIGKLTSATILVILLLSSCNAGLSAQEARATEPQHSVYNRAHSAWSRTLNQGDISLMNFYTDKAIRINPDGSFIQGSEKIARSHLQDTKAVVSISAIHRIYASRDSTIQYEFGMFTTQEGGQFRHLLILRKEGESIKRELEIISRYDPAHNLSEEVEKQRQKWMSFCNQHKIRSLVDSLYSPNALYYNHKPLVIGRDPIYREYGYMKAPQYRLKLSPIISEAVNNEIVFEYGQCSGSYGGKYLLVWQKKKGMPWQILIDSNI